jgi:hypothetical protein
LAPCPSNDGAGWSDGPVVSLRVQAAEVRAASVRDARTSHLVVGRDMGRPLRLVVDGRGTAQSEGALLQV